MLHMRGMPTLYQGIPLTSLFVGTLDIGKGIVELYELYFDFKLMLAKRNEKCQKLTYSTMTISIHIWAKCGE